MNHWESFPDVVHIGNERLTGGGDALKQQIWNAARDTITAWTGQQLAESSLYGIRVYKEGAVLAPHVDRLPLVSSAIINVDQDGKWIVVSGSIYDHILTSLLTRNFPWHHTVDEPWCVSSASYIQVYLKKNS